MVLSQLGQIKDIQEELKQNPLSNTADPSNPIAISSLTSLNTIAHTTKGVIEQAHRDIFKNFGKDMVVDEGIQDAIEDGVTHLKYIQSRVNSDKQIVDASLHAIAEMDPTSNKRIIKKTIGADKIQGLINDIKSEGGRIQKSIQNLTAGNSGKKGTTVIPERLFEQLSHLSQRLITIQDKNEILATIISIYTIYQDALHEVGKTIGTNIKKFEGLHNLSKQINTKQPAAIEYTQGTEGEINLGSLSLQPGVDYTKWKISLGDESYHSSYDASSQTLRINTQVTKKDGTKKSCIIKVTDYQDNGIINKKNISILDPYNIKGGEPQAFGFGDYPLQVNIYTQVTSEEHFNEGVTNKNGKQKEKLKGKIIIPLTIEQPNISDAAKKNEINKVYGEQNSETTPRTYESVVIDLIDKSYSYDAKTEKMAKEAFKRMGSKMTVYDDKILDGFVSQTLTNDKDAMHPQDLLGAIKTFIKTVNNSPLLKGITNDSYSLDNFFTYLSTTVGSTLPGFSGGNQEAFGQAFKKYIDRLAGGDYINDQTWKKFIDSNEFRDTIITALCSQSNSFHLKRPGQTTSENKSFLDHYLAYKDDLTKEYPKVHELSNDMTCKSEIYTNVFPKFGSVGPLTAAITLRDGKKVKISSDISYNAQTKSFASKTHITLADGSKLLPPASSNDNDIVAESLASTNDIARHIEALAKDIENSTGEKDNKRYSGHIASTLHTLLLNRIAIAIGIDEDGMVYDDGTEKGTIKYKKDGIDPSKGSLAIKMDTGSINNYKQDLSQKLQSNQVQDIIKAFDITLLHRKDAAQAAISGDQEIPKLLFPQTMMSETVKVGENLFLRGNKYGKVVWVKEDIPANPGQFLHYDSATKERVPYKAGEWIEGVDVIKDKHNAAVSTHERTGKSARKLGRTFATDIRHMAEGFVIYPIKTAKSLRKGAKRLVNYGTSLFRPQNEPSQYEDVEDFFNEVIQIDEQGERGGGDNAYNTFKAAREASIKAAMQHTYMKQSESTISSLSSKLKDLIAKGADDEPLLKKLLTNFIKEKLLNYKQTDDEITNKLENIMDIITNEQDPRSAEERMNTWLEEGVQVSKSSQEFVNKHSKNILEILWTKKGSNKVDQKHGKIRLYAKEMMMKNAFSEAGRNSRKVLKNLVRDQTVDLIHLARDTIGLGANTARTVIGHTRTAGEVTKFTAQGIANAFGSKRVGRNNRVSQYTIENVMKHMPPEVEAIKKEFKLDTAAELENHIVKSVMDQQMTHVTDTRAETMKTIGQANVKPTSAHKLREGGIMTRLTINGEERRFVMTEGDNGGVSISEVAKSDIMSLALGISDPKVEAAFQRQINMSNPQNAKLVQNEYDKQLKDMKLDPATEEGEVGYCKISNAIIEHRKSEQIRNKPSPILRSVTVKPGETVEGTGVNERIQNPHIMTSMMNAADNLYPKNPYPDIPAVGKAIRPGLEKVGKFRRNIGEGRKRRFQSSI